MSDDKIYFSDVKISGDIELTTAADKSAYGLTGDNNADTSALLTSLFQLRYFSNRVIYNQPRTDDIHLTFKHCTEYSPVARQLHTDNYIIAAGDIKSRFLPFVHDEAVVYLAPPDDGMSVTMRDPDPDTQMHLLQHYGNMSDPGFISMPILINRIKDGYSEFTDSENLAEVDGTVFICMLEEHLNTEWLERCMSLLQAVFPNTVFYLTTQSPVVLSQLEDDEAYCLFRDTDNVVRTKKTV
ncbi:hypothetical protein [Morganella psychrotolerans]|uniref:hypothetical protein n=1 Tax=Morganella psychrotolerans TaxID=368603 RepID=UPI0039B054A7